MSAFYSSNKDCDADNKYPKVGSHPALPPVPCTSELLRISEETYWLVHLRPRDVVWIEKIAGIDGRVPVVGTDDLKEEEGPGFVRGEQTRDRGI